MDKAYVVVVVVCEDKVANLRDPQTDLGKPPIKEIPVLRVARIDKDPLLAIPKEVAISYA
jgi:hypothetical protein